MLPYTAELSEVIIRHGLNIHQHADDTQLYLNVLCDDASVVVEHLEACLVDVKAWLRASRLRLNPTKTQVMWLRSGQQLAEVDTHEASLVTTSIASPCPRCCAKSRRHL